MPRQVDPSDAAAAGLPITVEANALRAATSGVLEHPHVVDCFAHACAKAGIAPLEVHR